MATSRTSSAAARLSRCAAASLRASSAAQSMRPDFAAAISPRCPINFANKNNISIPNSLSTSLLARVASNSALTRPFSTAAATGQIPGSLGSKKVEISPNWAAVVASFPVRTLWHMYEGMEEILADYVHQETTRTWMLISFKLFLLITMKDAFLALAHL